MSSYLSQHISAVNTVLFHVCGKLIQELLNCSFENNNNNETSKNIIDIVIVIIVVFGKIIITEVFQESTLSPKLLLCDCGI
jgi:uncharacterized membrane protein YdcZ (DUF606 family)